MSDKLETTPLRVVVSYARVLPTSRVFTSGYVNMETILHFFNISLMLTTATNEELHNENLCCGDS